jgi:hypothetical protein
MYSLSDIKVHVLLTNAKVINVGKAKRIESLIASKSAIKLSARKGYI